MRTSGYKLRGDGVTVIVDIDDSEKVTDEFNTRFAEVVEQLCELVDLDLSHKFEAAAADGEFEKLEKENMWFRYSGCAKPIDLAVIGEALSKLRRVSVEMQDLSDAVILDSMLKLELAQEGASDG